MNQPPSSILNSPSSRRKPHRLLRPTYSYSEEEALRASDEWGFNCGPAALAAMLDLKPDDVRSAIPDFDAKRYTNPTMMRSALNTLGVRIRAHKSISIQAYSFTSAPIFTAVIAAKQRGVAVSVILDKSWKNESPKAEAALVAAGIPVLIDAKHAIAHNKIIIIDGKLVLTGSFNFTNQAEHQNAENLLVITRAITVQKYIANFALHAAHSVTPVP